MSSATPADYLATDDRGLIMAVRAAAEQAGYFADDPMLAETLPLEEAAWAGDREAFRLWFLSWWQHDLRRALVQRGGRGLLTALAQRCIGSAWDRAADLVGVKLQTDNWFRACCGVVDGLLWLPDLLLGGLSPAMELTRSGASPLWEEDPDTSPLAGEEAAGPGAWWLAWATAIGGDRPRRGWLAGGSAAAVLRATGIPPADERSQHLLRIALRQPQRPSLRVILDDPQPPALAEILVDHMAAFPWREPIEEGCWSRAAQRRTRERGEPCLAESLHHLGHGSDTVTGLGTLLHRILIHCLPRLRILEQEGLALLDMPEALRTPVLLRDPDGCWLSGGGLGALLVYGEWLPQQVDVHQPPHGRSPSLHLLLRQGWQSVIEQVFPAIAAFPHVVVEDADSRCVGVDQEPWLCLPDGWLDPDLLPLGEHRRGAVIEPGHILADLAPEEFDAPYEAAR